MASRKHQALPPGYQLQEYTIDSVLNSGGFSYVYLARDRYGQDVAIKEYLPDKLATRSADSRVEAYSSETLADFSHGLKSFFEEGRALANIHHHNIVRVLNFLRANETFYMVMRYELGQSLQEYILSRPTPASENFVRRVFGELLNGLREVHTQKLLHLDIKPANIYLRLDGSPLLLDFGSVRQALSDTNPKLPPCYTPGFASPEQYFNRKLLGPWSDIYSIGASMYACLLRKSPAPADQRIKQDKLAPAIKLGQGIYSRQLLEVIDWCMHLDHMRRPQSVLSLQKALLFEPSPVAVEEKKSLMDTIRNKFNRAAE